MAQPHKIINDILKDSSYTIPLLSNEEIEQSLIQAIRSYRKNEISLEILVSFTEVIKKKSRVVLSQDIKSILEEIHSFSVIDSVLSDILYELRVSRKKKGKVHE